MFGEVTSTALVSILFPMVQSISVGAIVSVFFDFFESCILVPLCASTAKTRAHTNFKSPKIFPIRFGGILIQNKPT